MPIVHDMSGVVVTSLIFILKVIEVARPKFGILKNLLNMSV